MALMGKMGRGVSSRGEREKKKKRIKQGDWEKKVMDESAKPVGEQ